jgi:dienelactone hydrolase
MAVEVRAVGVDHDGTALEGLLVHAGDGRARPTVILFPTVMGRSDLELSFARRLVELGYTVFVADLYGTIGAPQEECRALMMELRGDRAKLQDRMLAVLDRVRGLGEVETGRVAAIGYCFGGLCALDLARTGADVRGVASFHGLFDPPGNRDGTRITAKVIAFHGWDDPLATPDTVVALAAELTAAGADWQIHGYGNTRHGFTNPNANNPERGVIYDETAARRSWTALEDFLAECLG